MRGISIIFGAIIGCLPVAFVLDGGHSPLVVLLGYGVAFAVMIIFGRIGYAAEEKWRS